MSDQPDYCGVLPLDLNTTDKSRCYHSSCCGNLAFGRRGEGRIAYRTQGSHANWDACCIKYSKPQWTNGLQWSEEYGNLSELCPVPRPQWTEYDKAVYTGTTRW